MIDLLFLKILKRINNLFVMCFSLSIYELNTGCARNVRAVVQAKTPATDGPANSIYESNTFQTISRSHKFTMPIDVLKMIFQNEKAYPLPSNLHRSFFIFFESTGGG